MILQIILVSYSLIKIIHLWKLGMNCLHLNSNYQINKIKYKKLIQKNRQFHKRMINQISREQTADHETDFPGKVIDRLKPKIQRWIGLTILQKTIEI